MNCQQSSLKVICRASALFNDLELINWHKQIMTAIEVDLVPAKWQFVITDAGNC